MAPVLHLGGVEIPSYTLMILVGFAAGYAAVAKRGSLHKVSADETAASYLLSAIGAFLGGKLFFILQGLPNYLASPVGERVPFVEYVHQAGLVFYGGMFGAIAFTWLSSRVFHTPFWNVLDTILPALPLAQAFGRVGCLFAGCCYGMPSSFGIVQPAAIGVPEDTPLFPIQLAESMCALVIFIVLMRLGRTAQPEGLLLSVYLLMYGSARFVLEFFRYDAVRGTIGAFSVSQWISLGVIVWGMCLRRSADAQHPSGQSRLLKY